jgi:hypothetical protein
MVSGLRLATDAIGVRRHFINSTISDKQLFK